MTETPKTGQGSGQGSGPRFLTIAQVAAELATAETQIRSLLKSGELPGMQIGPRGIWRIERSRLETYITEGHERTQHLADTGGLDGPEETDAGQ